MSSSSSISKIKECIDIYDSYHFESFLKQDLEETINILLEKFDDEWGFPLLLDSEEKNYYSSVTSTILISLHHINLLDSNFKSKIYESIFKLHNQSKNSIKKEKSPEDSPAWDISESANCYSTSLVLQALIETNYAGDKIEIIKEALKWLAKQQRDDGGWGFDNKCVSRVFFSAYAIHALHLGKKLFVGSEKTSIEANISIGLNFISQNVIHDQNNRCVYWPTAYEETTADPTNTLYALWILNKHQKLSADIKNKALFYLKEEIKFKETWDFNKIVEEMNTKYGSNKTIISFTPSFPLILLELDVDPFDDLCLKPIRWLKENYEKNWLLPHYKSGNLSFVYALGLWTLIEWHKYANKYMLTDKLNSNKTYKIKKRIDLLLIIILILIILLFRNPIIGLLVVIYSIIIEEIPKYGIIGFVASMITILVFIVGIIKGVPKLPKFLRYIDNKLFDNKVGSRLKHFRNEIYNYIYVLVILLN